MNKRKCTKIIMIALVLLLSGSLLIVKLNNRKVSVPSHRMQRWLKDIEWDQERERYTGRGIKIAVIDSDIDADISELENKVVKRVSLVSEENHTVDRKHATAIGTIIAGYPKNENDALGIAPDVSIVSIKVINDSEDTIELESLVSGINKAIEEKVDIINISIGTHKTSKDLEEAINHAYEKGIIVVAASGNYMTGDIMYPAKYPNVVSVGSLNKRGAVQSPKNYTEGNVVYLPGENVVTATEKDKYAGVYGTSFSTAICTGIVALVLEKNNDVSAKEVVEYFNSKKQFENVKVKQILDEF